MPDTSYNELAYQAILDALKHGVTFTEMNKILEKAESDYLDFEEQEHYKADAIEDLYIYAKTMVNDQISMEDIMKAVDRMLHGLQEPDKCEAEVLREKETIVLKVDGRPNFHEILERLGF